MKKHLTPDRSALPRLPYRLLKESWWLEENFSFDTNIATPFTRSDAVKDLHARHREVQACS